jgi:hypothetical protein
VILSSGACRLYDEPTRIRKRRAYAAMGTARARASAHASRARMRAMHARARVKLLVSRRGSRTRRRVGVDRASLWRAAWPARRIGANQVCSSHARYLNSYAGQLQLPLDLVGFANSIRLQIQQIYAGPSSCTPHATSAIEKRGRIDLRSGSWRIRSYSCRLLASPCTGCTDPREGELFCFSRAGRDSWNSSGTSAMYLGPEPGRTSAFVTPFAKRLRP